MWPAMLRSEQLRYRAFNDDPTKAKHLPPEISQVVSDKLDICTTLKFASLNKLGKQITSQKIQNVLRLENPPFNLTKNKICNSTYLSLYHRNISDDHMQILASAIGSGALPQLRHLELHKNQIGDKGLRALSIEIGKGSLPKLVWLDLEINEIGDAGIISLAIEIGKGALPKLTSLDLDNN